MIFAAIRTEWRTSPSACKEGMMNPAFERLNWLRREWVVRTLCGLMLLGGWPAFSNCANGADAEWAKWLPKETAAVLYYAGSDAHRADFEKTAAFDAYYRSGLIPAFQKAWNATTWKAIGLESTGDGEAYSVALA